jgi:putative alpha-1,2-mannosidase
MIGIPLGYVSADRSTRAVSRTVEDALNDFALSQVARGEAVTTSYESRVGT